MSDTMDVDNVHQSLDIAIHKQGESVLTMALMAGSLRGVEGAALKQSLRAFVLADLEDTYLLIEKMSALGGRPSMAAKQVSLPDDTAEAISALLDHEVDVVAALHAVIPHSGQEPRSEALEHLLEHIIMRKQQQIDYLWHSTNETAPRS